MAGLRSIVYDFNCNVLFFSKKNKNKIKMSAISDSQMLDEAESKVPYREEIAKYYLKKHRITDLFDNITAALVYQRPGNSNA